MKFTLMLLSLLFVSLSAAQEQGGLQSTRLNVLRSAQPNEFAGYWRIVLIPDEKLNLKIQNKNTGFADPCQFFIHKEDGSWMNISISYGASDEETRSRCPHTTKKDIDSMLAANSISPIHGWSQLRLGFYRVKDGLTGYDNQVWAVDYVTEDVSIANYFDFKQGDLIMNLGIPAEKGKVMLAWRMVLRPVLDQPSAPTPTVNTDITVRINNRAGPSLRLGS